MIPLRLTLLVLALGGLALPGCGRKDEPARPEPAVVAEPRELMREQDGDLLEPMPRDATPGPRLEERVDEILDG